MVAEHRAAMVSAVSGKRGKRYLKRQQLLELGEPALRYLTEIVHRRPREWFHDVDRLHQILQSHGPEVLRHAMEEGLKQQIYGAFFIERSLQAELSFPQCGAMKKQKGVGYGSTACAIVVPSAS